MSTSPFFSVNLFRLLTLERYKALSTAQLCADPFFQEWVFHPLGDHDPVFLDMMLCDTDIAQRVQTARGYLLQHSNSCPFIAQCIQLYAKMKEEIREPGNEKNFITVQEYWTSIREIFMAYEFTGNAEEIQFYK